MNTDISIVSNTIRLHGDEAVAGVIEGIGSHCGPWKVSLHEPANASRWEIHIEGPNGCKRDFIFDGQEQTRKYISEAINWELGSLVLIACISCGWHGWEEESVPPEDEEGLCTRRCPKCGEEEGLYSPPPDKAELMRLMIALKSNPRFLIS